MSGTTHRPRTGPRGTGQRGTARPRPRAGTKRSRRKRGTTLDQIKNVALLIVALAIVVMVVGPKYGVHLTINLHSDH